MGGAHPGDFQVTVRDSLGALVATSNFTIGGGESYEVRVQFAPTIEGIKSAQITFGTNDTDESSITLTMSGTAIAIDPGSTAGTALNIGKLVGRRLFDDAIGTAGDGIDVYRFQMVEKGTVRLELSGLSGDVHLKLIRLYSSGTERLMAASLNPGYADELIFESVPAATYRNRAIADARGEYVIFMDDDETAAPDWLCGYERLIRNDKPDAFVGSIKVMIEDERPAWLSDELLGFLGELRRADTIQPLTDPYTSFNGGNFGFRKTVCDTVGTFDAMLGRKGTDNTGGEEVDFYRRLLQAGFDVWWTPEAIIYHRIQAVKLKRDYLLDLHYRQGRMEAIRRRAQGSRLPPRYLFGQLLRAISAAWREFRLGGRNATVRKEMNVAYFLGQITGWSFGPRP